MKKIRGIYSYFILATLILFLLIFIGCSNNQTRVETKGESVGEKVNTETVKPIRLTMVSFLATDHPFTGNNINMWIEKVKEETNGAIEIEWIGGPESIPIPDQFDAVRNRIVDIGFNGSSYFGHLMPESNSLHLSPFTPAEERKNGYFDYLNKRFDKHNIVYLGRWLSSNNPFYFWSNKRVETLADLNGLKFRSNPTYHNIMQAFGMVPVEIVPGDVYTSLERNMVDGFGFPLLGPRTSAWTEVTQYIIDEPFLNQSATILINKEAFQGLTPELQEKMHKLTAEYEQEMIAYFNDQNTKEWDALREAGIEVIKLSPEDSAIFQETVSKVKWESLEEEIKMTLELDAPEHIAELKALLLNKN